MAARPRAAAMALAHAPGSAPVIQATPRPTAQSGRAPPAAAVVGYATMASVFASPGARVCRAIPAHRTALPAHRASQTDGTLRASTGRRVVLSRNARLLVSRCLLDRVQALRVPPWLDRRHVRAARVHRALPCSRGLPAKPHVLLFRGVHGRSVRDEDVPGVAVWPAMLRAWRLRGRLLPLPARSARCRV